MLLLLAETRVRTSAGFRRGEPGQLRNPFRSLKYVGQALVEQQGKLKPT